MRKLWPRPGLPVPARTERCRASLRTSRLLIAGGPMHGPPDPLVRPAAADVAAQRAVDLAVRRPGRPREERGRGHEHARLAVAALRDLLGDPGLLQGMAAILGEPLDRGDLAAGHGAHRSDAGAPGLAVHVDGAGPAERDPAAELGAGEAEGVADDPEERRLWIHVHALGLAVEGEAGLGHGASFGESEPTPNAGSGSRALHPRPGPRRRREYRTSHHATLTMKTS